MPAGPSTSAAAPNTGNAAAKAGAAASNTCATPARASSKLYNVPLLEDNGANFAFWKHRVSLVLQIRELWPLVDGTELPPTDVTTPEYANWAYRDREARAQIALTLADEPMNTVLNVTTAKESWDKIRARYEGKGKQKIAYLISDLFRSTLTDASPLEPQINAMIRTSHTLSSLELVLDDMLIAIAIIISLPPSYDTLKMILTATAATDLTVENVRSQIALEEQRRNYQLDTSGAFAAHTQGNTRGRGRRGAAPGERRFQGQCSHCKIDGHKARNCRKLKAEREKAEHDKAPATARVANEDTNVRAHIAHQNAGDIHLFRVTEKPTRCNRLKDVWLIDSGASRHMSSHRDWFL